MAFLANFTAIDFETANRRRDSACQLAAVVIRDGQIVDEKMWMIRPDPFFFSPGNIRIHGIRPADVENEKSFGELWPEMVDFFGDDCLIAHNAPFDIGVLIGCLERHHCQIPDLNFSCTRLIARQTWPDRQRFGLKPLANWLGVDFRHHDALEDSRACARILLAAGIAKQAESIVDLEERLRIVRGKAGKWGVSHASKKGRTRNRTSPKKTESGIPKRTLRRGDSRPLSLPMNPFDADGMTHESAANYNPITCTKADEVNSRIDWQRLSIRAEFIQPLRGKQIVICGRLTMMTHEQAIDITHRSGGTHQDQVDELTNCVVLGSSNVDQQTVDSLTGRSDMQVLTES
ncbi:MAG: hypothetical protein KDB00_21550, partial [Planctomycetales bacterium]|nr:hypothetical protein [Planctomycetales bacterium]